MSIENPIANNYVIELPELIDLLPSKDVIQTLTDEKDQNKIFVSVEFSTSLNPSDVGSLTVTPNTTSTNY